jgi:hypothetical protein
MSSLKNIFVVVALAAVAFFVYSMMSGDDAGSDLGTNSAVREELIAKTQSFIERSAQLQQINIDPSLFMDSTFTSLRSFSTPVPNQPLGRTDLFGEQAEIGESVISEPTE